MTTETKFNAAVNVIRNLPKNGSYQPSYDLMLRFYAYYKQATEGSCKERQPNFWEVVKKKKWEAWSKLGNMSKQQAMENYVDELKKIVETMSYTENVAEFLASLGSFYETVSQEDLRLLVGDVIERVSNESSSRDNTPQHSATPNNTSPVTNHDSDSEPEEFTDTFETNPYIQSAAQIESSKGWFINHVKCNLNGHPTSIAENSEMTAQISGNAHSSKEWKYMNEHSDIIDEIQATVRKLQYDLENVTKRVKYVESTLEMKKSESRCWPFSDIPPPTLVLIVVWPIVVNIAVSFWRSRRTKK